LVDTQEKIEQVSPEFFEKAKVANRADDTYQKEKQKLYDQGVLVDGITAKTGFRTTKQSDIDKAFVGAQTASLGFYDLGLESRASGKAKVAADVTTLARKCSYRCRSC